MLYDLFILQEVELGLAADVGTLQRLPKIVGNERYSKYIIDDISVVRNDHDEVKNANGENHGNFRYSRMRNVFDSVAASV